MNLTAQALATLRQQPHKTNLWLSIYQPQTIMTARVTGTYELGDYEISYYNASGSYLNLYPDLTVLVGTTPGGDDIGRIRLRQATGTYIVTAENALHWQNGHYLTMLDYVTVEAVYPRIIQDPSDAENVIFYKDFDIPYSNQNEVYGSFPCAGPHRAAFREFNATGTTAQIYYTATGTYNVAGSALTYSWTFGGGSPATSSAISPGLVTYPAPGHYKTRLRVTAANGAVDDTYRYVSIYDRPGAGSSPPILKWELQDFSGSRSEGGYTASFKVFENVGDILPNALVVIFADTWYGGTKTNIGGNAQRNSSIVFVGYIQSDTIKFNYKESYVEFQAGSISELMKEAEGFSVSCESKASPTTWFELQEMTVPKAMYHYLRWHSTVLKVCDFQYTGDDRLVQYFDADRGSLYDAVDSFMRDGMLGSVISDRQGKLWAEISSFGYQTPLSSVPTRFTFHKQDWIGEPTIQERRNSELSFIELGGIAYYGVSSNTFSALLTAAPSTVPLYHGKSDRNDGLILTSQQALNQVAGHYLAHFNTKFPNIDLGLAGTYLNLDIAPQEKTYLVIDANDSVRGESVQDLPYIVDGTDWTYDSKNEMFRPSVTLLQIATGTAGQTVEIPAVPPDGGYGYPDFELPPLPDFGGSNPVGPTVSTAVILHDANFGFVYTTDFDASSPQWLSMNGGLTTAQRQNANTLFVCPNGSVYCAYAGVAGTSAFIARAPYLGGLWTIIEDYTSIDAAYPGAEPKGVAAISYNPTVPESVGYVIGKKNDHHFYIGSNGSYSQGVHFTNIFNADADMSFGEGVWRVVGNARTTGPFTIPHYWIVSSGGGSITSENNLVGGAEVGNYPNHTRAGVTKITWIHKTSSNNLYRWANNFADTPDELTPGASTLLTTRGDSDATGMFLMAPWNGKGKSSDSGYSWAALPNLPVGTYHFRNAGSSQRWIAAGAVVRYSPDFGSTWINKEGDITATIAVPSINIIRIAS